MLTVLHAARRGPNKDSYKVSGGLHGVGVSCVNALSTLLTAEVHRQGRIFRQQFSQGTPLAPMEVIGESLGGGSRNDHHVQARRHDFLGHRIRLRDALVAHARTGIPEQGRAAEHHRPAQPQRAGRVRARLVLLAEGLKEFVQFLDASREPLTETPIYIDTEKDGVPVEVAMQYNTSFSENVHSYVNNINTIEGGTHLTGFRRALTRTLKKYAEDSGLLAES